MCLAVPGKIVSIQEAGAGESSPADLLRMGKVDFGGIRREVCLSCVPEAVVGDYVIVHVGFALSRVDAEEAGKVFEHLRQMDSQG